MAPNGGADDLEDGSVLNEEVVSRSIAAYSLFALVAGLLLAAVPTAASEQ
jgi:hypothetical protein